MSQPRLKDVVVKGQARLKLHLWYFVEGGSEDT